MVCVCDEVAATVQATAGQVGEVSRPHSSAHAAAGAMAGCAVWLHSPGVHRRSGDAAAKIGLRASSPPTTSTAPPTAGGAPHQEDTVLLRCCCGGAAGGGAGGWCPAGHVYRVLGVELARRAGLQGAQACCASCYPGLPVAPTADTLHVSATGGHGTCMSPPPGSANAHLVSPPGKQQGCRERSLKLGIWAPPVSAHRPPPTPHTMRKTRTTTGVKKVPQPHSATTPTSSGAPQRKRQGENAIHGFRFF